MADNENALTRNISLSKIYSMLFSLRTETHEILRLLRALKNAEEGKEKK